MMYSMTGYGKSICNLPKFQVDIEIKSLNSKQLDIICKIPTLLSEYEIDIRNILSKNLIRGKIFIHISVENLSNQSNFGINSDLAKQYYTRLVDLQVEMPQNSTDDYLSLIMKMPDVITAEKNEVSAEDWKELKSSIIIASENLTKSRREEAKAMELDIISHIKNIASYIPEVEIYEKERVETIKTRIDDGLNKISSDNNIDSNRLEQEMIFYIEKLDISEEKVRLKKHLDYFIDTANKEDFIGKKLAFIAQEIGREINTLGSKANHAEMQKIVVKMKDELEKIKEQLFNIL